MAIQQGGTDTWVKSSYSTGNGACVEIKSPVTQVVRVRDSKVERGPELALTPASWAAFVNDVRQGA